MKTFAPFKNESDSLGLGNLTFDNHTDCVSVSGDIDLTRDKAGLALAQSLQTLLGQIVAELEAAASAGNLPAAIERKPQTPAGNLFGLAAPK